MVHAIFGSEPQTSHTRITVPNRSATQIFLITSLSLPPSLTLSLPHSLPPSFSHSLSPSLPPSLLLSLPPSLSLSLSLSGAVCVSSDFECDNGNCEYYYKECDGYNDCGDNSDERDCGTSEPTVYRISSIRRPPSNSSPLN